MKKIWERTLAILLSAIFVFTALPISVVAEENITFQTGDIIEFGSYPQTKVTDQNLIDQLNAQEKTWISYNYYSGTGADDDCNMQPSDFMQYADISLGTERFRAVQFDRYRPSNTRNPASTEGNYNQKLNGYFIDTVYYFKYDPLYWQILDPISGLVMSEIIIDAQPYNNICFASGVDKDGYTKTYWGNADKTYYANNYVESSVRQYLNNDFYNAAFSSTERQSIMYTLLDSSTYSWTPGDSIRDKLFLLSRNEVENTSYGFYFQYVGVNKNIRGYNRQGSTDYAKCQGLNPWDPNYTNAEFPSWLLRSPGYNIYIYSPTGDCGCVFGTGERGRSTSNGVCGIRPAMCLDFVALTNSIQYDSDYHWTGEGFYSETAGITDSLEIYVQPPKLMSYIANLFDIQLSSPITMTATVDSAALSFDLDTFQNSYSVVFDRFEESVRWNDLILLYPQEGFSGDSSYTVTLTFSSADFDTITETCSFYVRNISNAEAASHLSFWENNSTFRLSRQNHYGHQIQQLSTDGEYQWSRFSSLDFKNYYDIVVADLLSEVLSVAQPSANFVPNSIKNWKKNMSSIRKGLKTIVFDKYGDLYNVKELKIDKIIKSVKYKTTDSLEYGIWTEDALYQAIVKMFGDTENVSKFTKVFSKIDKLNMFYDVFKWSGNVINDTLDGVNKVTLLESFSEADESFKDVIRELYLSIPNSNTQMKDALWDYLNYDDSSSGELKEYVKTICETSWNVTMSTFKSVVGKKIMDYLAAKLVTWVGSIELVSGTALSSTAAFSTVTSALSGFFTGVALGFAISDALCNSSDKAKEMAKAITMAEYSPYIIMAMSETYVDLCSNPTEYNSDCFEYAFALHKASQVYIVEHARKAMEYKRNSLMYLFADKTSMNEVISDFLYQEKVFSEMKCHTDTGEVQNNMSRRVINLTSTGNVIVYAQDGTEVCSITDNAIQTNSNDILCSTSENDKYILLPNDSQYTVKIVASESETMSYSVRAVTEEGQNCEFENDSIPLITGQEYVSHFSESSPDTQPDYSVLSIAQLPRKRVFVVGEALQTEGLQLSVYKNGGICQTLSDGFSCTCTNFDSVGTQFVTVSYGGLQTGYDIQIKNRFSGDVNADDELDLKDITVLCRHLAGGWNVDIHSPNADVNNDNTVNLKDAVLIRRYLAGGWNVGLI